PPQNPDGPFRHCHRYSFPWLGRLPILVDGEKSVLDTYGNLDSYCCSCRIVSNSSVYSRKPEGYLPTRANLHWRFLRQNLHWQAFLESGIWELFFGLPDPLHYFGVPLPLHLYRSGGPNLLFLPIRY